MTLHAIVSWRGARRLPLALLTLGLAAGTALAQIPDKFTNLQVAPKDIGKRELINMMKGFTGSLGVRCDHCHVSGGKQGLEGFDFASDEKEPKKVARVMMKMVGEINDRLLPMTGRKDLVQVRCITCHHGLTEPRTLEQTLLEVADKDGVPAAIARYSELRKEYYGQGAYDFSAASLAGVAEELATTRKNADGAIAVLKLDIEEHPDEARLHAMLGDLYAGKGDKDAAIASYKRCLELDRGQPVRQAQARSESPGGSDRRGAELPRRGPDV